MGIIEEDVIPTKGKLDVVLWLQEPMLPGLLKLLAPAAAATAAAAPSGLLLLLQPGCAAALPRAALILANGCVGGSQGA